MRISHYDYWQGYYQSDTRLSLTLAFEKYDSSQKEKQKNKKKNS